MLEVSHLTRYYDDFKAVDNVSFSIGKGEIVGLLGHNGAGKTTIMKMLSGYLEPNHGSITIAGQNIQSQAKQIQRKLGYLAENLPIYPELTVADYLDYAADLKGLNTADKFSQVKRAIAATELAEQMLQPIGNLSRGYKQRVGVAQALLGEPRLLILDEPTNGLDPTQTEHMRNLIRQIAKRATVILSTHIMQEVDALCDRALIVRNGQLVVDAKLADLRQSNAILLETTLSLGELNKSLEGIPEIGDCIESEIANANTVEQAFYRYRITINELEKVKSISAKIVSSVIKSNGLLYALTPEHRDLETLFRQVNEGKRVSLNPGVKNAA